MARFEETARRIAAECYAKGVNAASQELAKIYDEALSPAGIVVAQMKILIAVAHFGESGAPMGGIAKMLEMDPTTMARKLQPLEVTGLLHVARAPEDARVRHVFLTRSGERKLDEVLPLWERAQNIVRSRLGEKGAKELRRMMRELIASESETVAQSSVGKTR